MPSRTIKFIACPYLAVHSFITKPATSLNATYRLFFSVTKLIFCPGMYRSSLSWNTQPEISSVFKIRKAVDGLKSHRFAISFTPSRSLLVRSRSKTVNARSTILMVSTCCSVCSFTQLPPNTHEYLQEKKERNDKENHSNNENRDSIQLKYIFIFTFCQQLFRGKK